MRRGRFAGLIQPSPQERLQFFRTFFLWHLPLRAFLAHFLDAHAPLVSWQEELEATPGMLAHGV